jgi:hypothetical protein
VHHALTNHVRPDPGSRQFVGWVSPIRLRHRAAVTQQHSSGQVDHASARRKLPKATGHRSPSNVDSRSFRGTAPVNCWLPRPRRAPSKARTAAAQQARSLLRGCRHRRRDARQRRRIADRVCDPGSGAAARVDEAPPSLVRVSGGYFARSPVAMRSSITTSAFGRKYTG